MTKSLLSGVTLKLWAFEKERLGSRAKTVYFTTTA